MSKKAKRVLGVAVSVFAPMFAPWAAGAILGSSTITAASTALSAGIGALGGVAGANLQGQDWRQGAVLGGLTGGFLGASGGGLMKGAEGGAAWRGGLTGGATSTGTNVAAGGAGRGIFPDMSVAPQQPSQISFLNDTAATVVDAAAGAGETAAPTFMQRLADVSPGTLIQSGTQLALGMAGMSQEEKLLAAEQAEMERQRALEQEQFNRRVQAAEEMKGMAAQYDPQRVGLSQANIYGRQLEQQRREQLRSLTPGQEGQREAIGRQFDIAKATGRSTGYAQGYGAGLDLQRGFRQAAEGLYPTNIPGSARPSLSSIAEVRRATGEQVKSATAALEPITASMYPESKKKPKREETA